MLDEYPFPYTRQQMEQMVEDARRNGAPFWANEAERVMLLRFEPDSPRLAELAKLPSLADAIQVCRPDLAASLDRAAREIN